MQNPRCVRCLKDYDPANNVFGSCTWHSNHNFAKSNPAYVSIEEELRTVLPKFRKSFGKVDIEYTLSKITLRDLMLQIDSPVTRAIRGKLDAIPESIAKVLVEYPVEKLPDVISSRYSYDKQYQPTKRMALIMENMLNSMRIEDIDAQLQDDKDRLDTQFRYPHQHLFRGKYFANGRYVWRCCGLSETVQGCWTGVHSSVQRAPDAFTVTNFENANYRAFYDNNNLIVSGSEHVNNPIKNQTLRSLCSNGNGANFDARKQEFIKKVIAFNFYNGYEPTFTRVEDMMIGCRWQESERIQSSRVEKVEDLVEFSNLRLLVVFHPPLYRLSEFTINAMVYKLSRGIIFKSEEIFQYGSAIPLQPDLYLPSFTDSRLPEGTLLLPNSATRYLPRNPVSVTQALLTEFELLGSQRTKRLFRTQKNRVTQLSDAEWAPYEALRQAQLNSTIVEYQKQQRRAAKLVLRRQEADQLVQDIERAVIDSKKYPGSEPFVLLVEKTVKQQYERLFELPVKQQPDLLDEMRGTVMMASIIMRQREFEDQLRQGLIQVQVPLTADETKAFLNDMTMIGKNITTATQECENAIRQSKATPESKKLGTEIIRNLTDHIGRLNQATNSTRSLDEAGLIIGGSENVLETLRLLKNVFADDQLGKSTVTKTAAPPGFLEKLIQYDRRTQKWHLRSTLQSTKKGELAQQLHKLYSKTKKFLEKYSPTIFSSTLKDELKLFASSSESRLQEALDKMTAWNLVDLAVISDIKVSVREGVELAKLWYLNVRIDAGEKITDIEKSAPVFYSTLKDRLSIDPKLSKPNFDNMLKSGTTTDQEESSYIKARIYLYRQLLEICIQSVSLEKFVYKIQAWLDAYLIYDRRSSVWLHVTIDPIFLVPLQRDFTKYAKIVEDYLIELFINGYSTLSYETETQENFATLKELHRQLETFNSPPAALLSIIQALDLEIKLVEAGINRFVEFVKSSRELELNSFIQVDSLFEEWDSLEKIEESFGTPVNTFDAQQLLDFSKALFSIAAKLHKYFGDRYLQKSRLQLINAIRKSSVDSITKFDKQRFSETVDLLRLASRDLYWTKRFRSERDLLDMRKLWLQLNFPPKSQPEYIRNVNRLIQLLRRMQLFVDVSDSKLDEILRTINSKKDFAKIVVGVLLPLEKSCDVKLTRYTLPTLRTKENQILLDNFTKNLVDLDLIPRNFVHPPKGKQFKVKKGLPNHYYKLKAKI